MSANQKSNRDPLVSDAGNNHNRANLADERRVIAVFTVLIAITLALLYWIIRVGFENPVGPVLRVLSLPLLLVAAPFITRFVLRRIWPGLRESWLTNDSVISFTLLGLMVLLGRLHLSTGFTLYPLVQVAGIASLFVLLPVWLRGWSLWTLIPFVLMGVLFGLFMAASVWGLTPHGPGYLNPLFAENLLLGTANRDTLFHAGLANVFTTYLQPSTGLDGYPYLAYHYGSHFVLGQLAALVEIDTLTFYQLGYPVVLFPLFFYTLLHFSLSLRRLLFPDYARHRRYLWRDRWFWFVVLAIAISPFPYALQFDAGILWERYVSSESYNLALSTMFVLLGVATAVATEVNLPDIRLSTVNRLAVLIVIPLLVVVAGFFKVSTMVLVMVAYGYLFLRGRLFRSPMLTAGFLLAGVLSLLTFWAVNVGDTEGYTAIRPFAFIEEYVGWQNALVWLFISLFWVWVAVGMRVYALNIRNVGELRAALLDGRLLTIEIVLVVALIGALPGLLLDIPGMSAGYFADIQKWIAAGIVIASISPIFQQQTQPFRSRPVRALVAAALLLGFAAGMVANFNRNLETMVDRALWTRSRYAGETYSLNRLARDVLDKGSLAPLGVLTRDFRPDVEASPRYTLYTSLHNLHQLPLAERSQTGVFIPQSNLMYWDWLHCVGLPFVSTALTGMAMFDGLPPVDCDVPPWLGYSTYGYLRTAESPQYTIDEGELLCEAALERGFSRLIVVESDSSNGETITQTIVCDQ